MVFISDTFLWLLLYFLSVQGKWAPSGTVPDVVIALSPDGRTAIAQTGIYTHVGAWTMLQPIEFTNMRGIFLSEDGTVFAISHSNPSLGYSINIYKVIGQKWTISSTINGSSLGVDNTAIVFPSAVTSDGNTLIVVSTSPTFRGSDVFVLDGTGLEFALKQQLMNLPLTTFGETSLSADGATLAILWSDGLPHDSPNPTPVSIFSRGPDGMYEITEEHESFVNWMHMTISRDGQIMFGSIAKNYAFLAQIFTKVDGRYQFMNEVNVGSWDTAPDDPGMRLCISSDASLVFTLLNDNKNNNLTPKVVVLKQSSQFVWSVAQTVTGEGPVQNNLDYNSPILCSIDGSAFLYTEQFETNPSTYVAYAFIGPVSPSPSSLPSTATTTTTTTTTAITTATSTASSTSTATSSSTASSTSTSSSISSASVSSTRFSSLSQTPSPSAGTSSSSSLSSAFAAPSVTITISVLSTALILFSVVLGVKWLRRYFYQNRTPLYADSTAESGEKGVVLLCLN